VNLARYIDHTKLTFEPEEDQEAAILKLCEEAKAHNFYAVCVRPEHVVLAKQTGVRVATVIGFPQARLDLQAELASPTVGNLPLSDKLAEIEQAKQNGADELDVVIDVAHFENTLQDLIAMQASAGSLPLKVIFETDLLSEAQIAQAIRWCAEAGMAMVKTSTGMLVGAKGADLETVGLMANVIKKECLPLTIKASGGIKTTPQAEALLALGVRRLGTSAGVNLISKCIDFSF